MVPLALQVSAREVCPDQLSNSCTYLLQLSGGIEFGEFVNFFSFLNTINDVEVALTFYHVAGAPINKGTVRYAAPPKGLIGHKPRLRGLGGLALFGTTEKWKEKRQEKDRLR